MSEGVSPEDLANALTRLSEWAARTAPGEESEFSRLLREHFGADPSSYPITSQKVAPYDRPNLQLALDAYLADPGRSFGLHGLAGSEHYPVSLASMAKQDGHGGYYVPEPGPVDRSLIQLGKDRSISCVDHGVYLIADGDERVALMIGRSEQGFQSGDINLDVMTREPEVGERFLTDLRALMKEHNVFRGKVVSLGSTDMHFDGGGMFVTFHDLPDIARNQIVFPEGVLERIERNTITFAAKADALLAAGRHLRRGVLLHGPPGTGKTLTAKYLASALEGRTVLLLAGSGLGHVGASCALARELQPSMVVLEDVDLVAQERTMMGSPTALLFELLNEMDGLSDDADVIFLLTTNRAEILEPALASRPGRVDLAIELPLPDAASRRRLIDLYCEGLDVQVGDFDAIVARTDQTSPAFLRELVRKATLVAVEKDETVVRDEHFAQALDELEEGGRLTKSILGSGPPPGTPGGPPGLSEWGDEAGGFEEDWDE